MNIWDKKLEKVNRPVPTSAFTNVPIPECNHVYRYLRPNGNGGDVFYCEKCLEYKIVW